MLRIRDVYPGSRIQKQQKKRRVKKNCSTFFVATKITKLKIILILNWWRKKIWTNLQRIKELSTQKVVIKLSKIWVWDPGSGKNLFQILGPGSRGQKAPDPGSRSATLHSGLGSSKRLICWKYVYLALVFLLTVSFVGMYGTVYRALRNGVLVVLEKSASSLWQASLHWLWLCACASCNTFMSS